MAEKSKWVANLIVSFLNIQIFITGFCESLRNEIFHGFLDARCWDIRQFSFSLSILSSFNFSPWRLVQTTRVCSVSKTFECQLQEYVIKTGGISLKIWLSHLQDASKSSRDEIEESTECCSVSIPHDSRPKYFIASFVFFQIFQRSQLNRAHTCKRIFFRARWNLIR